MTTSNSEGRSRWKRCLLSPGWRASRGCYNMYVDEDHVFTWYHRKRPEHVVSDNRTYESPEHAMSACESNLAEFKAYLLKVNHGQRL